MGVCIDRLHHDAKVGVGFTQSRAEGPRKSHTDRT